MKFGYKNLFVRLIFYFFLVILIPIMAISVYYYSAARKNILENLEDRSRIDMLRTKEEFKEILDNYRHKAYLISIDPTIVSAITKNDTLNDIRRDSEGNLLIYEQMFNIMDESIHMAIGVVVSLDGNLRYATHRFPEKYDLRYNQHDFVNPFFSLERAESKTASIILLDNRYLSDNNFQVVLNIERAILDGENNVAGYAVVDLFENCFDKLNEQNIYDNLVLYDSQNYTACSLTDSRLYGNTDKFENLNFSKKNTTYSENGRVVSVCEIEGTSLRLFSTMKTDRFIFGIDSFYKSIMILLLAGLFVAVCFAFIFTRIITKPVKELSNKMKKVQDGDFTAKIETKTSFIEFQLLYKSFNEMVEQISSLIELNNEEQEKVREAERKALCSQMQPHFLYNTLNIIKSIAKLHDEKEIYTISVKLGKLLRFSINNSKATATLEESLDLVSSYLIIQKIRFAEKLQYSIEIDPILLNVVTPKLIIQPFVENSIIHGLEPKIGDWKIDIKIFVENNWINIIISDNGIGSKMEISEIEKLSDSGHVGIYNVYRRLKLYFGQNCDIEITTKKDKGTKIKIMFLMPQKVGTNAL